MPRRGRGRLLRGPQGPHHGARSGLDTFVEAMAKTSHEIVELTPAARGTDLFSVIEAAQYARVIDHDDSAAEAVNAFVARFTDYAEAWERKTPAEQTAALERLGEDLEALGRAGLYVYWAAPERDFVRDGGTTHSMPLAVVKVAPRSNEPVTVRLPAIVRV